MASTVRSTLQEALVQILAPKRRIDILRDAIDAKSSRRPYVVTFCGVNGVGKSTNLAKVRDDKSIFECSEFPLRFCSFVFVFQFSVLLKFAEIVHIHLPLTLDLLALVTWFLEAQMDNWYLLYK